jgi:hypothetical protein
MTDMAPEPVPPEITMLSRASNACCEEFHLGFHECLVLQQLVVAQHLASEAADGERWAVHSQRWNDGIHARAIRKTRIY